MKKNYRHKDYQHTVILNNITNKLKYCLEYNKYLSVSLKIHSHGNFNNYIFINVDNLYIIKCSLLKINYLMFGITIQKIKNKKHRKNFVIHGNSDTITNKIINIGSNLLENEHI